MKGTARSRADQQVRHDLRSQVAGAEQLFTAIRLMSSSGCAVVLSGGFTCREVVVVSKPRTETSSGTGARAAALTTAAPISSLIAKIAVTPGSCCSSSSPPAAPFVEEGSGGGDGRAFGLGRGAEVAALAGLGHVDRRWITG
jgi:hypothetical protein